MSRRVYFNEPGPILSMGRFCYMEEIINITYRAIDGSIFNHKSDCEAYEKKCENFLETITEKIGDFEFHELQIGEGVAQVDTLPFEAPWLTGLGACLIKITDLRRDKDGKVEFQLGDEKAIPYKHGTEWVFANDFFSEWPS